MQEYKIITVETGYHFESAVNAALKEGWKVAGGLVVINDKLGQAVYRKKKVEKVKDMSGKRNIKLDGLIESMFVRSVLRENYIRTMSDLADYSRAGLLALKLTEIDVEGLEVILFQHGFQLHAGSQPIESLTMISGQTLRALKSCHIDTIEHLCSKARDQILRIEGLDRKQVDLIEVELEKLGLELFPF